jgi:tRNA dimethylallyltransferase
LFIGHLFDQNMRNQNFKLGTRNAKHQTPNADLQTPTPNFHILAGPTGIGKTDLALDLAQRLETEIVSADAFQIYRGFDVLSGKPSPEQLRRIPHHLVGVLPTNELCDAFRFAELARAVIRRLNQRRVVPLVVGGSGFYLEALTSPLPPLPKADLKLRRQLEARPRTLLLEELKWRDPVAYRDIDRRNWRRVIRAIEVCILTGQKFSDFRTRRLPMPTVPAVLLTRCRDDLYARINRRVERMFVSGAIEEVRSAREISRTVAQMIGVKPIQALLAGDLSYRDCLKAVQTQTRQFARRQMTWFRSQDYQPLPADTPIGEVTAHFLAGRLGSVAR